MVTLFMAAGCGERDLSDPPKVQYGKDTCAECRMIIQDERFACAAVSGEGRYLKFDDVGCLALSIKKQASDYRRIWLNDPAMGWLSKDQAHFVYDPDRVTPMGYGVTVFGSAESADQHVREKGGRVVFWDELLKTEEIK